MQLLWLMWLALDASLVTMQKPSQMAAQQEFSMTAI